MNRQKQEMSFLDMQEIFSDILCQHLLIFMVVRFLSTTLIPLFKNCLTSTIDKHAPKKKRKSWKSNPWLTREIRQLMNTRDFHLRKFKQTDLDFHWQNYKRLRNSVTSKVRN